jgi:DNA-binding transcriptional LysR family regulator
LGVISFKPDTEQYRSVAVYADTLAFVVNPNHALARAERVSIADLGEETFVAHNVPSPLAPQGD